MESVPTREDPPRMTRAEFRRWAETQDGKWELIEGYPVAQAAQRAGHARMKGRVFQNLADAIASAGLSCEAFINGLTVEVSDRTDYIPDVVVQCGDRVGDESVTVDNPVIVVEVISPSSVRRDMATKLDGYFQVPSIQHYLIFYVDRRRVIHHRRQDDGSIRTTILTGGTLDLTPPGLYLEVESLYPDLE